jgi:GNAT superfamily N-acetyltransferase
VVDENHRGRGLGKWLMECITNHETIKNTKQFLATKDAHGLYEQYGFVKGEFLRKTPDIFK